MSIEHIRKAYGVPAKRGGRVEVTLGERVQLGTIIGASRSGLYLRVRLDGNKRALHFHPDWGLRYLDADDGKGMPRG